jgi:ribosome assembly protein SQT1
MKGLVPSGNTMHVLAVHTDAVNAGAFTPDGKHFVTGGQDGILVLWDPKEGQPIFKLTPQDGRFGMEDGITSIGVNAASTLAVVGGSGGAVRVVNLANGSIVGGLEGHKAGESVESVAFVDLSFTGAGAGGLAITGGTDGKACVWDVNTMRLRMTLEHTVSSVSSFLTFIYRSHGHEPCFQDAITTLLPHPAPHSHLLTTASSDKTLKTWDLRNGNLIREHKGHQAPILGAALSLTAGGSKVVSAGDDGVCLVFETN